MDDPVQTNRFIRYIIDNRKKDIVGLAMTKGNRMTVGKKRSKFVYLITLLLIMGLPSFLKNSIITLSHKLKKILHSIHLYKDPTNYGYVKKMGIPVFKIRSANSQKFLEKLRKLEPDVVINQSQNIIKKKLIDIPTIGVINRHNALLPKNRGRLSPFWVLYKQERKTGISIHFVNEGIDSGCIIVQEKFNITKKDTFNSIVKKNYEIAPIAMLKALNKLESGKKMFISNNNDEATYNTVPELKHAWAYRKRRFIS